MENTASQIPEGYMENAQGCLVPLDRVKEIDRERDALVREIVGQAVRMSELLENFKMHAMADIGAFVELSAEKYGAKVGGNKGNVQLTTYDGEFKVRRDIADHLEFDERLQAAKSLIDECLHEWTEGIRSEIRVLIGNAFQVDKAGKISTARVLGLRRVDIQHPKWRQAMDAISDSLQIVGSKAYLRIYKRQADGSYRQVNLDLAAL
jgi:hypothetical protein